MSQDPVDFELCIEKGKYLQFRLDEQSVTVRYSLIWKARVPLNSVSLIAEKGHKSGLSVYYLNQNRSHSSEVQGTDS